MKCSKRNILPVLLPEEAPHSSALLDPTEKRTHVATDKEELCELILDTAFLSKYNKDAYLNAARSESVLQYAVDQSTNTKGWFNYPRNIRFFGHCATGK